MSYINAIKHYEIYQESSITSQIISDFYIELSGSRISYTPRSPNSNIVLSFSQNFQRSPDWNAKILMKLQESIDNFALDISDISGSHSRIQSVGSQSSGTANGTDYWFFENQCILNSWNGKKYFRVLLTSEDTNSESTLQKTDYWQSSANSASQPVSVLIKEI